MADENSRYRQHRPHHVTPTGTSSEYANSRADRQSSPSSPTKIVPPPLFDSTASSSANSNALPQPASNGAAANGVVAAASRASEPLQHQQPLGPSTSAVNTTTVLRPRKVVADYRLTKTLGQGSMGKVKLAIHLVTGEKVFTKVCH